VPKVNIVQHETAREIIVKPVIEAAHTETWHNALDILFISGHVISFSPEPMILPCLISAQGPIEKTDKSLDLLSGKGNVAVQPLISSAIKLFLPKILMMAQLAPDSADSGQVAMVMTHIIPEFQKHEKELARLIMQGAFSVPDLIVPGIFTSLIESRDNHLHCCSNDEEYEEMIQSLKKLGIIEPIIQVSICPECANYQLILSKNPIQVTHCPKCGSDWASVTFYSFENNFSKIKYDSSDIALFISSYLRFKIENGVFEGTVNIYPKVILKNIDEKDSELDVFIPEFNIGIECKIFEDAFAPMTSQRINSISGKLSQQIERYEQMNVQKMAIVTNLTEIASGQLENNLNQKLKKKKIDMKIKVLPGNSQILLETLNDIVKKITESMNKKMRPVNIDQLETMDSE
jgi:ribosomal protein L37AE/L43A